MTWRYRDIKQYLIVNGIDVVSTTSVVWWVQFSLLTFETHRLRFGSNVHDIGFDYNFAILVRCVRSGVLVGLSFVLKTGRNAVAVGLSVSNI